MPCHCGGECQACRADEFCKTASVRIVEIDMLQRLSEAHLRQAGSLRKMLKDFGDRVPFDDAETKLRQKLAALTAERQRLVEQVCRACGVC